MSLTIDTKWNKTTSAPSNSTGQKSLSRRISLIKWYLPVCKKENKIIIEIIYPKRQMAPQIAHGLNKKKHIYNRFQ